MIRTALALILLLTACGSEFRVQEQASETTDFIVPLPVVTETGSSAVSSFGVRTALHYLETPAPRA